MAYYPYPVYPFPFVNGVYPPQLVPNHHPKGPAQSWPGNASRDPTTLPVPSLGPASSSALSSRPSAMPSEMYTGINTGRPQLQFALPYNQPSVQYNLSTLSYSQYSLQYDQLPAPCNQPPVQHRPCVQYDQPPVQHQLSVQYNQPPVQHQPSVKYNQESAEYIQPTIQYQQPSVQYTQSSDLSNNPIASHVSLNSHPSNAPPAFYTPICEFTGSQCIDKRNNNCNKVHFDQVIRPHTDVDLGDCFYLDSCYNEQKCKYVHYLASLPKIVTENPINASVQSNASYTNTDENHSNTVINELDIDTNTQWINMNILSLNFKSLGNFAVIIADRMCLRFFHFIFKLTKIKRLQKRFLLAPWNIHTTKSRHHPDAIPDE